MILIAICYHGREKKTGDRGVALGKFLGGRLFHVREMPYVNIEDRTERALLFFF